MRSENSTFFEYDNFGNVVATTDARGGTIQREFNDSNQIEREIDALGRETNFRYNSQGFLVATVDALGNIVEQVLTETGELVAQIDALGNTTGFVTDAGRSSDLNKKCNRRSSYHSSIAGRRNSCDLFRFVGNYSNFNRFFTGRA